MIERINAYLRDNLEGRLRGFNKRIKSYRLIGWLILVYLTIQGTPGLIH
jgi:hypothetical protein